MTALTIDLFPASVTTPNGKLDVLRVLSDGTHAWIFQSYGSEAKILFDFQITSETIAGENWSATAADGFTWNAEKGGGCGCGNPLRRVSADSLLALAGVT